MPAPTVEVTITLDDGNGTAYKGVVVTARLDQADVYTAGDESFIIADDVTGTTDANGTVVLDLFPNHPTDGLGTTGSTWYFSARPAGAGGWHYAAQIPNVACNLANLTNEPAPANPTSFAASVRTVLLTGFSSATATAVSGADTVLSAIGKLQGQVTANLAAVAATVRATVLTGLSLVTATAVEATDSVLVAIGKLQAQISGFLTASLATPLSTSTVVGETGGVVKRFLFAFLSTLTGAVARTFQSKAADFVSVADFGAVGDGTDESAKIQAAINAAALAGSKTVYFPEGATVGGTGAFYNFGSTTISVPVPEMKLVGQKYTKIKKTGTGAFFEIAQSGYGFEATGFWFVGDNTDGQTCFLFSGEDNGFYMQGPLNPKIHSNWFEAVGSKTTADETAGGAILATSQVLGLEVSDNICSQGGYLVRVTTGSDGIKISHNVTNISRSVAVQLVDTAGSATVEVSNNNLANVGGAVFLKAAGYVNVFGNTCIPGESEAGALGDVVKRTVNGDGSVSLTEDATTGVSAAFWISSAQVPNISQNVCAFGGGAQDSDYGIYISNAQSTCFVSNNFVTGYGTHGIRVYASQPHILVNNRTGTAQQGVLYSDNKHPGIYQQYTTSSPFTHYQGFGTATPGAPFEFSTPASSAASGFVQVRVSNSADPTEYIGLGWDDSGDVGYLQAYKTGTGYKSIRYRSPSLFLGGSGDTTVIVQAGSAQGSAIFQVANNALTTNYIEVGPTGVIKLGRLSTYADNAAASGAGLAAGSVYRTATGQLMIVY